MYKMDRQTAPKGSSPLSAHRKNSIFHFVSNNGDYGYYYAKNKFDGGR
jgi:hypothetical protein